VYEKRVAGTVMLMASLSDHRLSDTEGYLVESPEGEIGRVEEVWLDQTGLPRALAVRTGGGRHGLLLESDVVAVQREQGWVVVPSRPPLLELAPPRLAGDQAAFVASWSTTGATLPTEPRRPRLHPALPRRAQRAPEQGERPLWRTVLVLYGCLALIVGLVTAAAFLVADLVGGAPY
jgi:hypothetical protein